MTLLTHCIPKMSAFDRKMLEADLSYVRHSQAAQTAIAGNYIGLPM